MISGLSIPTSPDPPRWLVWLCAPKDGPLLVVLLLVVVIAGLGLLARRRRS